MKAVAKQKTNKKTVKEEIMEIKEAQTKQKTRKKSSKAAPTRERGRPTRYNAKKHIDLVYKLAVLGATDAQLAQCMLISERTLNYWKESHPDFLQSIKRGKIQADAEAAHSLYRRACGYSLIEERIFKGPDGPIVIKITKHYPPDTAACIFWLKNRCPDRWRDKVDCNVKSEEPLNLVLNLGGDPALMSND